MYSNIMILLQKIIKLPQTTMPLGTIQSKKKFSKHVHKYCKKYTTCNYLITSCQIPKCN